MNNRVALLSQFGKKFALRCASGQQSVRKLYTNHIYPYPYKYFNEVRYPSQVLYRETWPTPEGAIRGHKIATRLMQIFWTYFFWQLLHHPDVFLGHARHLPDPRLWTDAELGIPDDEVGLYEDWIEKKYADE